MSTITPSKSLYRTHVDPRTGKRHCEHRAVAEWKPGCPLLPSETLHHVDQT